MSNQPTPQPILKELWNNWKQDNGGGGRCAGCPAHWSKRSDFSGMPGERTSSYQHRPLYGDGSLNPKILIVAREPGKPAKDNLNKNKRNMSFEEARNESILDSPGGTIKRAMPLFKRIESSEFAAAFTQIRKCNELRSGNNTRARKQCAGTADGCSGYLADEVAALAPDYIITLTTKGLTEFCSVFDLPEYDTEDMASGSRPSGLRGITQDEFEFTWFPAPHPDPRGASQVYNRLEGDFDTKEYFETLAEDILRYIRTE